VKIDHQSHFSAFFPDHGPGHLFKGKHERLGAQLTVSLRLYRKV
jgi:hypothetical protein